MIHVRMNVRWKYREDPDGNAVREFPPDRTYSIEDDDAALIAIAEGAAELTEPLDADKQQRLEMIKAAIAGDEAAVAALLPPESGSEAPAVAKGKKK